MIILSHSKFNVELNLFFLASNRHACRRQFRINSASTSVLELYKCIGVNFTSFKFLHNKKEISILECAQSNDKETTDTKDANELALDEIIEIVVSSWEASVELSIFVTYASFKSLITCLPPYAKNLEGVFVLGLAYELKEEYIEKQKCPYCGQKLIQYGRHIKIIKDFTKESDVLFSKGYEFKKFPISLPRMKCSNDYCQEKINRYKQRNNGLIPANLEDVNNITHVLFEKSYTPFLTLVSSMIDKMIELTYRKGNSTPNTSSSKQQLKLSLRDDILKTIYPLNSKYNPVWRHYEQITALININWYRAKYDAKRVYNKKYRPTIALDSITTTTKFNEQKIKKFSHRLRILLIHFLCKIIPYYKLRPRTALNKIAPESA